MSWSYRRRSIELAADSFLSSVVLLALNENGADTTTVFDDASNSNHTLTAVADAQWDSASAPTGLTTSALFDGTGDHISVPTHADFAFGTGDFTIEAYIRTVSPSLDVVIDFRPSGPVNGAYPTLYHNANAFHYFVDSADRIDGGTPNTGNWQHIAVARVGGSTRMFVGGAQVGSTWTDTTNYAQGSPYIGGQPASSTQSWNGQIAALRITKGVGRYNQTFTPPTLPLPVPV